MAQKDQRIRQLEDVMMAGQASNFESVKLCKLKTEVRKSINASALRVTGTCFSLGAAVDAQAARYRNEREKY